MDNKQAIKDAIEYVFDDWSSSFSVELEGNDDDDYEATINYTFGQYTPAHEFYFYCRVKDGKPMFAVYEDVFEEITDLNLFQWLFFEMTTRLDRLID